METIEKTIEVDAPVSTVYNQWTQFEEFPMFMEGIKEVRQLDDKRLHWVAEIAGKRKEWDAEKKKWALKKVKWQDCNRQADAEKLKAPKSWSFIGSCMTKT